MREPTFFMGHCSSLLVITQTGLRDFHNDARWLSRAGPLADAAADATRAHLNPVVVADGQRVIANWALIDANAAVAVRTAGCAALAQTPIERDDGRAHGDLVDLFDQLQRPGGADCHAGQLVADDTR